MSDLVPADQPLNGTVLPAGQLPGVRPHRMGFDLARDVTEAAAAVAKVSANDGETGERDVQVSTLAALVCTGETAAAALAAAAAAAEDENLKILGITWAETYDPAEQTTEYQATVIVQAREGE